MADSPPGRYSTEISIDQQRRDARDSLFMLARIRPEEGGDTVGVRVRNVSAGGLMAQAVDGYRPGIRVIVELDGIGTVRGVVAWQEAGRIGVAFDHPVDKALARKPVTSPGRDDDLFRPMGDTRRPPLRSR